MTETHRGRARPREAAQSLDKAGNRPLEPVRFGVVGAGWIAQYGFMPALARVAGASLAAIVSGSATKRRALADAYGIARSFDYEGFGRLLTEDVVDALYVAVPNQHHHRFAEAALASGRHVLLEKPMATSLAEGQSLITASKRSGAKLMLAHRLHFEPATCEATRLAREGALGELRAFSSVFTQRLSPANHRSKGGFWTGPVADMAPYPINIARHMFMAEPNRAHAFGSTGIDSDTVSVVLGFEDRRTAQFTVSFAGMRSSEYVLSGTEGRLEMRPGFAFGIDRPLCLTITSAQGSRIRRFPPVDQFAALISHFTSCIRENREPGPDGEDGLRDLRVIEAIRQSLITGMPQDLESTGPVRYLDPAAMANIPARPAPNLIDAAPTHG